MSATVTFYGKMLNVGCFVLLKVWKKALKLPLTSSIPFQLVLALAFWCLGFTLYEWRKSIVTHPCFTRNDSWLVPPSDPHWQAEVFYRKHVIWREITASCLSLIDYKERNHSVCSLKIHTHIHTQPLFTSDTPTRAGAGIYSLQNCSRLTSGLLRK